MDLLRSLNVLLASQTVRHLIVMKGARTVHSPSKAPRSPAVRQAGNCFALVTPKTQREQDLFPGLAAAPRIQC
jgi:hypothetical protein